MPFLIENELAESSAIISKLDPAQIEAIADAIITSVQKGGKVILFGNGGSAADAMHLAAALGTPGVAIFGSTDPIGTGPLGAPWHILAATAPCRPCFRRTCPLTGADAYQCLAEITPDDVTSTLKKIL